MGLLPLLRVVHTQARPPDLPDKPGLRLISEPCFYSAGEPISEELRTGRLLNFGMSPFHICGGQR